MEHVNTLIDAKLGEDFMSNIIELLVNKKIDKAIERNPEAILDDGE